MLTLELLPAACGDCVWLEYGEPARIVVIDGGLKETGQVLRSRLERARRERGSGDLHVELLVVTHIDTDHILGIIDLLRSAPPWLHIGDVWFNGRPQLLKLPPPQPARRGVGDASGERPGQPGDLMGQGDGADDAGAEEEPDDALPSILPPADLLGSKEGDQLSELLGERCLAWNRNPAWKGGAIVLPESGALPAVTLAGGLRLTLLGPTLARLHQLCAAWPDVLGGRDEHAAPRAAVPGDLLGRRDGWPPVWSDAEGRDPSKANASSIMVLAEHGERALLLPGDGRAPDLAAALERLSAERYGSGPIPLDAFKLSHHGSANNLTRAVLEGVRCSRYLVSTDGSTHGHPDHLALLRILRYARGDPPLQFFFNHACETTLPWQGGKGDVVQGGFRDYEPVYPQIAADGVTLRLH